MAETSFQKKLFREIKNLHADIEEISKHATPHLVGEIRNQNDSIEINLSVSAMEDPLKEPLLIKEDNTIMFILPIKNKKPYRIYMDVISLISGKKEQELKSGTIIQGDIRRSLKRLGYEVLWIHTQNTSDEVYFTIWASKNGERFTIIVKPIDSERAIVKEIKKI
ncbi:hypothetical protein [Thermococcus sp. LS2]|uniref:hypothetical protein n=1 Tax=Thermococcus sp. LS2 TaxID=1638260 RepID=UPI00143B38EA|nr:hypothetical protein [Thermococcus sp. LS2]NJE13138.1 hypothetical protein [Thermococcus sp. LS2]